MPNLFDKESDERTFDDDAVLKYLVVLRAVDKADYMTLKSCLPDLADDSNVNEDNHRRFIARLIEVQSSSRYSKLAVSLKAKPDPKLPPNSQIALISDDNQAATVVTLRRGIGIEGDLQASLRVQDGGSVVDLLAAKVSIEAGGLTVQATFPSLSKLDYKYQDLIARPLVLTLGKDQESYKVRPIQAVAQQPDNPVSARQSIILADATGLGRITLSVGEMPTGKKGPLKIIVSGADLREDKSIGSPAPAFKGSSLVEKSTVTLLLGNLMPSQPVSIRTVDGADGEIGKPVQLTVHPMPSAAQK